MHEGYLLYEKSTARKEKIVKRREAEIPEISNKLKRVITLGNRYKQAEKTYSESQMTFQQVTAELDKIIQEAIGDNNFSLDKRNKPREAGLDFLKQEYTITIKSLTLKELVNLLHKLEFGEAPLFLAKLVLRSVGGKSSSVSATLEVFSISKKTV